MSCNNKCETCVGCGEHPQMRNFSKVLTPTNKERLKSIVDRIREGNKELSIFIDDVDEPEMFLLSSIYEAIEDEIATLDACINS